VPGPAVKGFYREDPVAPTLNRAGPGAGPVPRAPLPCAVVIFLFRKERELKFFTDAPHTQGSQVFVEIVKSARAFFSSFVKAGKPTECVYIIREVFFT